MLQPEVVGAVMEVTKWLKPSMQRITLGDPTSAAPGSRNERREGQDPDGGGMRLSVADDLSRGYSIAGAGSLAFLHISFESRTDDCNIHGGGYRATLMTPPCRRRIAPRGAAPAALQGSSVSYPCDHGSGLCWSPRTTRSMRTTNTWRPNWRRRT